MKNLISLIIVTSLCLVYGVKSTAQNFNTESYVNTSHNITFNSSDDALNNVFSWAKKQALSYAFEGDVVGLWYEAALPGRESFCMRDVSHQAMGAQFLGLASYTKNMLYMFAKNISDARDWCSLWEINRHGTPALQDYLNNEEFWYNLPANFDILNCCFRMYNLTGDQAYITDPVFLNFYKRTVYDYVERWDVGIDKVMIRDRWLNNSPENNRKFKNNRGIPGYEEGDLEYTASLDLITTEQVAFEAYAKFQVIQCNDREADIFFAKSDALVNFINTIWWDKYNQRYYSIVNKDRSMEGREQDFTALYFGMATDTLKIRKTLKTFLDYLPKQNSNFIEGLSHLPELLYNCEQPKWAREMLLSILESDRREYPEASFSTVGAMVSGLMGVELGPFSNRNTINSGEFNEQPFITKSRLTDQTKWAEMNHIPLKRNDISVRHEGTTKTVFTNNSGPQLRWRACFMGAYKTLRVNSIPVNATTETIKVNGEKISWINVIVGAGEIITVETN